MTVNDMGRKRLLKCKKKVNNNDTSVGYRIPRNGCDGAYYGESCKGLISRLKQNRAYDMEYTSESCQ